MLLKAVMIRVNIYSLEELPMFLAMTLNTVFLFSLVTHGVNTCER